MQIYGPFRVQSGQNDRGVANSRPVQAAQTPRSTIPIDELDISPEAQAVSRLGQTGATSAANGDIRAEKVASIRRAIAEGSYDTPEKLDVALSRFLDRLG